MPTPSRRRRRALGLLLAPAVCAGALVAAPAPAAAQTATPNPALGVEKTAVNLSTFPGFLTLGGTGVSYDTPTTTGMVVASSGYFEGTSPPAEQQDAVFATYGGSERIGRSTGITAPEAVAIGVTDAGQDVPGLRLATLHDDTGGLALRLSERQADGFGDSGEGPLDHSAATSLALNTVSRTTTEVPEEAVVVTGGPDGLAVHSLLGGAPRKRAELRKDPSGNALDVLEVHGQPLTDPSSTLGRGLARNGTTTVLYRYAASTGEERVARGTLGVRKTADGSGSFTYTPTLSEVQGFDVPGRALAGQSRRARSAATWVTAVRVQASEGDRNVLLEAVGSTGTAVADLCEGDGAPAVALLPPRGADPLGRTTAACTSVLDGTVTDQLRVAVVEGRSSSSTQPAPLSAAVTVPGLPVLDHATTPTVLLDLPGTSLTRSAAASGGATSTSVALTVRALVRGGKAVPGERAAVASATFPVTAQGYGAASPVLTLPAGAQGTATGRVLGVPLDMQRNRVDLTMTAVEDLAANPVPLAFVQAPPTVRGARQDGSSATYGKTSGSATSQGTSTATRIGAALGIEWEDPSGAFGASVEASYTREVEQSYESGRTVETTESYTGAPEQDNVVYRADTVRRYTGTVTRSSMGVALGTAVDLDVPRGSVVSIAPVGTLQARFPDFRGTGSWASALAAAFPHRAGDPGSYLAHGTDGRALDDYCDGTREGGVQGREVTPPGSYTPVNPFVDRTPTAPGPDILVGERHTQVPGSGVVEGSDISLSTEQAQAFVSSHSLDVTASFKAGYLAGSVTAGATWAEDWSSSLSSGQGFSAEVAAVPSAELTGEGYDWRMFVCRKTVPGPGGTPFPVFVQGFLVDGYRGSGGLQGMSPLQLVSPVESQVVRKDAAVLSFRQDAGSVREYAYRVEAVGRNQVLTGTVATFGTPSAGTPDGDGDGDGNGVDGRPQVLRLAEPLPGLLPNQLYRWRVTATDFFGNTVTSDYEFFTVDGPPRADLTASTLTPDAGAPVTLFNNSQVTDLQDPVTCRYDFGDGTQPFVEPGVQACAPQVEHTWRASGSYDVVLTVCVTAGCSSDSVLLTVNGNAADDAYEVLEDSVTLPGQLPSVLANDGGRTATLLDQTAHGALELRADGFFRYTPDPDFCGRDMFSYFVDGTSTRSATAVLDVLCRQDAPRPGDDEHQAVEDTELVVGAPGLLRNDVDPDATADAPVVLRTTLVQEPAHGSVTLAPDGSFRYVPARDRCGDDSFRYAASDGTDAVTATVRLTVACVNDAPVAVADAATVDEDSSTLLAVTANDVDVDGDVVDAREVGLPAHGVADGEGTGVRYQPAPDFCGTDSFTYRAADPSGALSAPVTVTVTVVCRNDAPVAAEDVFVRKAGSRPHQESAPGVLANDTDRDSAVLTAVLHSRPSSGDLVLESDGSFVYTPRNNGQGGDTFYYRTFDGTDHSAPVRVVLTVTQGGSGK